MKSKLSYSTTITLDSVSAIMTEDTTVTSDHITATETYVMWCGEHVWNVSVLQGVNFSKLVSRTLFH